ncbi:MAG: MASE1 domain-containing protein [Alcanivoracaceae bacterium]|nr:MASE1 domain-containing protein [Alcanivoracaceae bacterium]
MPQSSHSWTRKQRFLAIGVLAGIYFLTGRAGLSLYITEVGATLVWPPTGISIAALLVFGLRLWPGIFAGALLTNLAMGNPVTATAVAAGNTAEAVTAYALLRMLNYHQHPFNGVRPVLAFFVLAAMIAPAVSATVGAASLTLTGLAPQFMFPSLWRLWWAGDMMGALLLTPLLVLLANARQEVIPASGEWPQRLAESSVMLFLGLMAVVLSHGDILAPAISSQLTYLPIIPVLWAALRFSRITALSHSFAVAALAIALTIIAVRDAGRDSANDALLLLYIYLVVQNLVVLLVSTVVHERNRMEQALKQARQQAEAASAQKSQFLTNISHEIRTPLNGILGVTALMLPSASNDTQRDQLRIIQSSADSLLSILNDVLDHARIEAGKLTIEKRTFFLPRLLRDVVGLFESQAEAKGLRMVTSFQGDLPRYVVQDDIRLRQILVNLISNAVKFTRRGSVTLEASLVDSDQHEPRVQFVVRDTGIGIPGAAMSHVFEAFTQADSSTSRLFGGSGLGLTISKQLAERLGGSLELVSLEGVGTEVGVTLPMRLASQLQIENLERSAPFNEGETGKTSALILNKHVLVVEDNDINAQVTEQMLKKLGFKATVATDGEQALARWQQGFDLILMDCNMPRMDGYQATREIRKLERDAQAHIPIVALTANAMKEEREKCLSAGMDDYLPKPIRLHQLEATLKRHLAPT